MNKKSMQAAVLAEPGMLLLQSTSRPACPPGGVLIKVKACGICSADVKMARSGHPALVYPRIPGHEISGLVLESRHQAFREGERVQVAPGLRCGRCRHCRSGADNQCRDRQIIGFTRDGGFAQMLALPLTGDCFGQLTRLPDNLDFTTATLAEPLACCLHAQQRAAVGAGDRVMVVGAGPLGLLHLMLARKKGAGQVFMVEVDGARRQMAEKLGADLSLPPAPDVLDRAVRKATGGLGVDLLILACAGRGVDAGLAQLVAAGGRILFFSGLPADLAVIGPDANQVHYREWTFIGSYGCTAKANREAVALLADPAFPAGQLISRRISMDQLSQTLKREPSRDGYKIVVEV